MAPNPTFSNSSLLRTDRGTVFSRLISSRLVRAFELDQLQRQSGVVHTVDAERGQQLRRLRLSGNNLSGRQRIKRPAGTTVPYLVDTVDVAVRAMAPVLGAPARAGGRRASPDRAPGHRPAAMKRCIWKSLARVAALHCTPELHKTFRGFTNIHSR